MADDIDFKLKSFSGEALKIAAHCQGLSLIEADQALDDARRFIWIRQFTGASQAALEKELNPLANAIEIIRTLEDVTPLGIEKLFLEVRMYLWMQNFARVPGSLFAKQLQAHSEVSDGATIQ